MSEALIAAALTAAMVLLTQGLGRSSQVSDPHQRPRQHQPRRGVIRMPREELLQEVLRLLDEAVLEIAGRKVDRGAGLVGIDLHGLLVRHLRFRVVAVPERILGVRQDGLQGFGGPGRRGGWSGLGTATRAAGDRGQHENGGNGLADSGAVADHRGGDLSKRLRAKPHRGDERRDYRARMVRTWPA